MAQKTISTVSWRKYLDSTNNPRVEKFLKNRGSSVLWQISQKIHNFSNNQNHVIPELVMIVHPNAPAAILIPHSDYNNVLDLALDFFEKKEDYEKCQKIVQFKKDIKPINPKKKTEEVSLL